MGGRDGLRLIQTLFPRSCFLGLNPAFPAFPGAHNSLRPSRSSKSSRCSQHGTLRALKSSRFSQHGTEGTLRALQSSRYSQHGTLRALKSSRFSLDGTEGTLRALCISPQGSQSVCLEQRELWEGRHSLKARDVGGSSQPSSRETLLFQKSRSCPPSSSEKPGARGPWGACAFLFISTLHLPFSSPGADSSFGWDEPGCAQRQEKLSRRGGSSAAPGSRAGRLGKYSKTSLPSKGNKSCAVPPAADLSLWNSAP